MPRPDVRDERIPQILDAAARIFSRYGIDGASMSQIAEETGLSKATIYHYFESKDALIEALVRRLFDADQPEVERLIALDAPSTERLLAYTENLAAILADNQALYPVFAESKVLSTRSENLQHIMESYFTGYASMFARIIQQGIERGEIRADVKPENAGLALTALIEGVILLSQNMGKPLADVMSVSVGVFVDGLNPL